MPPLAPNVSGATILRPMSGWNNSSMSRRSGTTSGFLSTRTPQSSDTTSGGMLNPPLPPSTISEATPRGATGSFRPRTISLVAPSGGGGALPLSTWASKTLNETLGLGAGTSSSLTPIGADAIPNNFPTGVDISGGLLNNEFITLSFVGQVYRLAYTTNNQQLVLWDPAFVGANDGFAVIMPGFTPIAGNLQISQIYDNTTAANPKVQTFNINFT
jgi:hypothetical protein